MHVVVVRQRKPLRRKDGVFMYFEEAEDFKFVPIAMLTESDLGHMSWLRAYQDLEVWLWLEMRTLPNAEVCVCRMCFWCFINTLLSEVYVPQETYMFLEGVHPWSNEFDEKAKRAHIQLMCPKSDSVSMAICTNLKSSASGKTTYTSYISKLLQGCASIKGVITNTMTESTLGEYEERIRVNTTTPEFNKNVKFKLGDEFLKILQDNAFNGTDGNDVVDHIATISTVDKFVLPIDFVILDMPEDSRIPIILGRPFLATTWAMIDVFNKKITLRVGDDEVIFDMDQSMKKPPFEDDECYSIDDLEPEKIITEPVIRRIDSLDTAYPGEHQNDGPYKIKSGHLYSASANEIDEKKPELKVLPYHLEYAYLNGFFQILFALEDQEKTTFTCPYGTFTYRRMPFGLCNALVTFQRCMTTIFHDMVKDFMEVFMDDFSVFANSFDGCLVNLDKMLARCKETNLVLNWEKFYIDHCALKYLSNKDAKPRLIQWVLLLQGFNIEIKDKKGAKNLAADHLSRMENLNMEVLIKREIADEFPDEHLMMLMTKFNDSEPWYVDYMNYILGKVVPTKWSAKRRKRFHSQVKIYF
ncbi:reverse transcriptase domain-containing protein [Tanacetum coccineum]